MATRIGADIGGTFTDCVLYDDATGNTLTGKVPTTVDRPEAGCLAAVDAVANREVLARCRFFLHGTTVGLNAILQRRGAKVGLITTAGFRDILEIRRGTRERIYDPFWAPAKPLVRRSLRLGVHERVASDGTIVAPVKADDILKIVATFQAANVNSIGVCLLNAYANGAHELEIEQLLHQFGFAGSISLSHRLSGEYGEFERTSTTVIDAFVSAEMRGYLGRLERGLRERGFVGTLLITRSGGGAMSFDEACQRSFETIMSGPVAGTAGASELSRRHAIPELITADVGGTSFDTCVIRDGEPDLLFEGSIEGMPLQTSWVDVRSIGAGGGSIAHLDAEGALRVGPRSSGSQPGPACYGRGGTEPTLTDAAFHLGMLAEGALASGLRLDPTLAARALGTLAAQLSTSIERTAIGIIAVSTANMANAIREITVERGLDPRGMCLVPFGGAGPLLAINIARELDINRIVIPPHAGNFSAWGLLGADIVRDKSRTLFAPLNPHSIAAANLVLSDAYSSFESNRTENINDAVSVHEGMLDIRYRGQEYSLTIRLPLKNNQIAADAQQIQQLFEARYQLVYGNTLNEPLEIAAVRAATRCRLPRYSSHAHGNEDGIGSTDFVSVYSFVHKKTVPFRRVQRKELKSNALNPGPMIILEATATTYIDADCEVRVAEDGSLIASITTTAGADHDGQTKASAVTA